MERVDYGIKQELVELARVNGNNRCVDCDADSPQWASPKFGIYICLSCAGVHRSLGVHISFVRSITMDNFKPVELEKMKAGGNDLWRQFFNNHQDNLLEARTFDDCTIKERYDSNAGSEWKSRLTAKVEGREFDPDYVEVSPLPTGVRKPKDGQSQGEGAVNAPIASLRSGSGPSGSGYASRSSSPAIGTSSLLGSDGDKQKKDNLNMNLPGMNDFQKDPVMAITMGLGWLGATVSKGAKEGLDDWVKPGVQRLAETDITTAASLAASQINHGIQTSTRTASEAFNRLVDGRDGQGGHQSDTRSGPPGSGTWTDNLNSFQTSVNKTGQSFWDSLAPALSAPRDLLFSEKGTSSHEKETFHDGESEIFFDASSDLANPAFQPAPPPDTASIARAPPPRDPPKPKAPTKPKKPEVDFWDEFGMSSGDAKPATTMATKRRPKAKADDDN